MPDPHPLQFHGIDHVVLTVTSIAPTLVFYTEILGLKLERIIEDVGIYQLRCGRNLIDLKLLSADKVLAPIETRGVDHLCLLIRGDFEAVLTHLARHQVEISFGPVELYGATGFGTSVYVRDPDGHTIELKADHALAPMRTTAKDAAATLSRPPPAPQS